MWVVVARGGGVGFFFKKGTTDTRNTVFSVLVIAACLEIVFVGLGFRRRRGGDLVEVLPWSWV